MAQDRYANNSTAYEHPPESNLLNIHKAMEYNAAGEPVVRVSIGTSTINISGPVTIPGSVEINNDEGNPIPVTGTIEVTSATVYQGTDPWNITGTVFVQNFTSTVSVDNFPVIQAVTGTVTVLQGTSPWHVDGTIYAISSGTSTVSFPTGGNDAFGRLRVSEPYSLFDTRTRYYDHQQFSSRTTGSGTVNYIANESVFNLTVNGTSGSEVVRESMRVFPYQPGKSLLILNTFVMAEHPNNLRQRVGFFGEYNGIFFEQNGTDQYFVIRSYTSGGIQEERKVKTEWNGPDKDLTIYTTAPQIMWIDIEWLGVGSVRCGFIVNGEYKLMHTFHHANITLAGSPVFTTTYMTTACLPVRYEITNTGATGSSHTMKQICSSVMSEGGYNAFSTSETAGTGITPFRLVTAGTYYPVVSIRLAPTRLDAIILPRQVDILSPTVNYYRWVLLQNPTLSGATWLGTSTSGSVQYDTGARVNAVTGGIEMASGYISSRELSVLGADFFSFQLGRTLQGVSDVVTLALAATSNNADVLAQIGWQEVT